MKQPPKHHRTGESDEAFGRFVTVVALLSNPSIRLIEVKTTSPKLLCALFFCSFAAFSAGCHRQYYRLQADQEAHCLIDEKSSHIARGPVQPLRITVDERSRMFNPFDLDFQPMPLDDPASHRYMQCVDGRRGYPMWDAAGVTNSVENPEWWQFLPLNENGVLVLDADTAVEIALMNSPAYQAQLETLYLSALDVSSQRFVFDTQFFGGLDGFANFQGSETANGSSSQFGGGAFSNGRRDLAMQRAFASGGELVVGIANNIVWELSGPNTQSATTLLDFTFVQPLLRNAGRDKVLEALTFSERQLLANVRAFERYRRSFYLNVTIGRGTESTVRRGGGAAAARLDVFGGLGGGNVGGGGGGGGGGVPQAGGFLGLLQDQLQIRNLEENIARLSENLLVLENTLIELLTTIPDDPEAIVRQRLQVAQAKSALLGSQSTLVGRQTAYQSSVDTFMRTLGLPPYICVEISDPLLESFELIDRDLRSRREELIAVRTDVGALNVALLGESETDIDSDTGLPKSELAWTPKVAELMEQIQQRISPLDDFLARLSESDSPRIQEDIKKLSKSLVERRKRNAAMKEFYEIERESICTLLNVDELDESIFDISELETLQDDLQEEYDALDGRLKDYAEKLTKLNSAIDGYVSKGDGNSSPEENAEKIRDEVILASQELLSDVADDVLMMQLIQARARTESVVLPEVDIDPSSAFEIARHHRRDWANARASLVDSWRSIEFFADDLESSLDLTFSGGVANDGNNPLNFRSRTGRMRVGLQWDAPITRLRERNTYRQSLIEFEQAKRSFYQFEDGIWQLLRGQIRQLQANGLTFELGRQSVRIAAAQIELNEDIRILRDSRGLSSGPTAARDTISAFSDLLNSQNALLDIFVNYEVLRRGLDFDLGTMQLTPEGLWIDPGPISAEMMVGLPGVNDGNAVIDGQCTQCCLPLKSQPPEPSFAPMLTIDDEEVIVAPLPPSLGQMIQAQPPEIVDDLVPIEQP